MGEWSDWNEMREEISKPEHERQLEATIATQAAEISRLTAERDKMQDALMIAKVQLSQLTVKRPFDNLSPDDWPGERSTDKNSLHVAFTAIRAALTKDGSVSHAPTQVGAVKDFKELREAEAKATKGPWEIEEPAKGYVRIIGGIDGDADDNGRSVLFSAHVADVIDTNDEEANAAFIARARNDVPLLLAELDLLRSDQSGLKQIIANKTAEIDRLTAALAEAEKKGFERAKQQVANYHETEIARLERQIVENTKWMERVGSKDHSSNNLCEEAKARHKVHLAAILAMEPKP